MLNGFVEEMGLTMQLLLGQKIHSVRYNYPCCILFDLIENIIALHDVCAVYLDSVP
jgi:hypothetical protein